MKEQQSDDGMYMPEFSFNKRQLLTISATHAMNHLQIPGMAPGLPGGPGAIWGARAGQGWAVFAYVGLQDVPVVSRTHARMHRFEL